jgi:hypothetical protein
MYILALTGAKVVHPRAVSTAIKFNRPFWVRSTFNDEPGTLIGRKGEAPGGLYGISLMDDVRMASLKPDFTQDINEISCNEWFSYRHHGGATVIMEPARAEELEIDCQLKEVGVVTLQWDPASGITPDAVDSALRSHGILPECSFQVPDGGAWAVAPGKAKEALLALYRAPLMK